MSASSLLFLSFLGLKLKRLKTDQYDLPSKVGPSVVEYVVSTSDDRRVPTPWYSPRIEASRSYLIASGARDSPPSELSVGLLLLIIVLCQVMEIVMNVVVIANECALFNE